jgi:hypothetical protein
MNQGRTLFAQLFAHCSRFALESQLWIAISVYVLVAIIRKRLQIQTSLYTILQILSVSLFEKIELSQALSPAMSAMSAESTCNQLSFLDL